MVTVNRQLVALDTETTGVDFYHGARPFFVSAATMQGKELVNLPAWEWEVDPLTRQPIIPAKDLAAVQALLDQRDLVLQNAPFDAAALETIGVTRFPWQRTDDTLTAGHLLASNQAHDLTSMVLHYLGIDIEPYEIKVKQAVNEARAIAKKQFPDWHIAKKGDPAMPSAKGEDKAKKGKGAEGSSPWKFDMWLPRAIAKALDYKPTHPWWTVTAEYSNADTATTLALWQVQKDLLHRRKYWAIYKEKLKVLPIANNMKRVGITLSAERLDQLSAEYKVESEKASETCINIAKDYSFELVLPKGGVNNSLRQFVWGELKLEPVYNPKAKSDGPSLDKGAISYYLETLEDGSKPKQFIETLVAKRSRDTALTYMEGYTRFWKPLGIYNDKGEQLWYRLHPSLNPTGTDTLRWSSSNPNEQNISKKEGFNLRYTFGPAPGRVWYSFDAKGIEDRLPAYKSKQQELIDIFERADEPPFYGSNHLLRFSIVYPDIWEAELHLLTKELGSREAAWRKVGPHIKKKYAATNYQWCKNGGFAVQYGAIEKANGWGTADRAFHKQYAHRLLKSRLSKLEALNQQCIRYAEKYGYVETMPDRTVDPERGYPIMCTRTEYGRILPTVPLNYYIQGTAMWWTMKGMIRCQAQLDEWNKPILARQPKFATRAAGEFWRYMNCYHLIMQVHDELVFDFPKVATNSDKPWQAHLPKLRKLRLLMEEGGNDIGIPTPVNMEYHPVTWSEGITI